MVLITTLTETYRCFAILITRYLNDISSLFMRLLGAKIFLDSGLSKWNGWFDFNDQKYDLFLYEFFCPDPLREGALLLCNPETLDYEDGSFTVSFIEFLALSAGIFEVVLPILLIVGLFSRIGALGLIGMTLFIQLAVFPTLDHWWNPAAWWAVVLFGVFAFGPGKFSLDHLFNLDRRQINR